jgi:branched-chain amino acid aminotransferase
MHGFLLHNGRIYPNSELLVSAGQVGYLNGLGVFSTIRVAEGVPFAFERHWARMQKDAQRFHVPMPPDPEAFRRDLLSLVEANRAYDSTLRVAVIRNRGGFFEANPLGRDYDVVAFTTDLQHWGTGAKLTVQPDARHGASPFAGSKITSWAHNLTWLEDAKSRGFDEVILLDEWGRVSECTSANIFAVSGTSVYTPPLDSGCLPGITRGIILNDLSVKDVRVEERHVTLDDLFGADSVFLTSTTRELLSVQSIDGKTLHARPDVRERLHAAFRAYASNYVAAALRPAGVT